MVRHCAALGCSEHVRGGAEGGEADGGVDVECWECGMFKRIRERRAQAHPQQSFYLFVYLIFCSSSAVTCFSSDAH